MKPKNKIAKPVLSLAKIQAEKQADPLEKFYSGIKAQDTKDGYYKTLLKIGGDWPTGTYTITARYDSQDVGSLSFKVNLAKAK